MEKIELIKICDRFLKSIPKNLNYITPRELKDLIENDSENIFLLDNRTAIAYKEYHIPNSINIFYKNILNPENIERLPKDKTIIVTCWVGHTASQVLTVLQLLGYNALGLKYGMGMSAINGEDQRGWKELNYPLKSGK